MMFRQNLSSLANKMEKRGNAWQTILREPGNAGDGALIELKHISLGKMADKLITY